MTASGNNTSRPYLFSGFRPGNNGFVGKLNTSRPYFLGLVLLAMVGGAARAAVLELRPEATVFGPEVRLKQVCRWEEGQEGAFEGWGDLVVTRLTGEETAATVGLLELKCMLRDAGMSLASVRFAGPVNCVVTRASGGPVAAEPAAPTTQVAAAGTGAPAVERRRDVAVVTLKERLTRDLADRLALPVDALQIAFNPQDEKLLGLSEPQFRFQIEPRRARTLGSVSWEVTAVTEGGVAGQKAVIGGMARAWQEQLVANRPISGRQVIRAEDVVERRALVDSLPDAPMARRDQVVGQQATMDLKPGAVVTSHMVQALPLARVGQLVTVVVKAGGVSVRTVGKAVDEGTYGQTIRVRNEGTKEMYDVTLTGPQQGIIGTNG
jgi:flagella basal body P-ring formation protein FlgA